MSSEERRGEPGDEREEPRQRSSGHRSALGDVPEPVQGFPIGRRGERFVSAGFERGKRVRAGRTGGVRSGLDALVGSEPGFLTSLAKASNNVVGLVARIALARLATHRGLQFVTTDRSVSISIQVFTEPAPLPLRT